AEELKVIAPNCKEIVQAVRGGTGQAARLALVDAPKSGQVLICAGDTPLLTSATLSSLIEVHNKSRALATVLTTELPDPFGYGRIVRDGSGELASIVEERDADEATKEIAEINSGVYVFDISALNSALAQIGKANAQGEEYLTDVIAILKSQGHQVSTYQSADFTEILGINDRAQLSDVAALMRDRINDALMRSGVTMLDPASVWIDSTVEIEADVQIEPGVAIKGSSKIKSGAKIGPRTTLIDCEVGTGATVIESHCESSEIGARAKVGPFAHLRGGTVLADEVKVGSFVEMKNSTVGEGSKVPHLSYVGDAQIGRESNIGAATIFVNYDGVSKHETKVGDHVRIGSDSMLIAPVEIGDGAYTAAGSIINEDVPAGALGIARARQVNILGWVLKKRKGTKSAEAAEKKERK
ncbi:MAG: UDP-N-acetylglucosamine diphosphorylase/glucosamine-1-phosphate N-acetyltransferase, partial [Actinobacteria bacterium]|nr:UDP-N-acetylglucosamine diphosphorylase/glucosamine-1-phosphate N-acetyltransferase [Actinomycetota bacterium]